MNDEIVILSNSMYYVYEHYLDGKLFYVGKGQGDRCFNVKRRSKYWLNLVKDRECEVKIIIVAYFYYEKDAYEYESQLIKNYASYGEDLVNRMHNSNNFINEHITNYDKDDILLKLNSLNSKFIEVNQLSQIENVFNSKSHNGPEDRVWIICTDAKDISLTESMAIKMGYEPVVLLPKSNNRISVTARQKRKDRIIDFDSIDLEHNLVIVYYHMIDLNSFNVRNIKTLIILSSNYNMAYNIIKRIDEDLTTFIMKTDGYPSVECYGLELDNYIHSNKILNKQLTTEMKNTICEKLNIPNNRGTLSKWPTIKGLLLRIGYEVIESTEIVSGKRARVSYITTMGPEDESV